jgi:hypothetical protein
MRTVESIDLCDERRRTVGVFGIVTLPHSRVAFALPEIDAIVAEDIGVDINGLIVRNGASWLPSRILGTMMTVYRAGGR